MESAPDLTQPGRPPEEADDLRRQLASLQDQMTALLLAQLQAPPVERPVEPRPVMHATDRPRGHRLNAQILLERLALVDAHDPAALAAYDAQVRADGWRGDSPPALFRHTSAEPSVRQG